MDQVNIADLQPQATPEPVPDDGLFTMVQDAMASLLQRAKEMDPAELFAAAKRGGESLVDYELDKGRRLVDTVQNFNVNDTMGDVVQGASEIPAGAYVSAGQTFGEVAGILPEMELGTADGKLPEDSRLNAAAIGAAMALPFPGAKAKAGVKVAGAVGDLARAPRGAEVAAGGRSTPEVVEVATDYRGGHTAPGPEGAPFHNLIGDGAYPDDVYGPNAVRYYGSGDDALDHQAFGLARALKGKPRATVTIYRAVPAGPASKQQTIAEIESDMRAFQRRGRTKGGADKKDYYDNLFRQLERTRALPDDTPQPRLTILPGDWVTINKAYAKSHGESALQGKFKILSKKVQAQDLFTDGNSIQEWGYNPKGGK